MPEFEIDAQAVTWAQFGEFVEDGGYDDPSHWSGEGWAWVERSGRRTPRHVDQFRHGVLQHRFGRLARVPQREPAMHLSHHEADAWCRWAGRRLPGEGNGKRRRIRAPRAAFASATRGSGRQARSALIPASWPAPWRDYSQPFFGKAKVLRGASSATPPALRCARFRGFAAPERDDGFFGFRSCAA